MHINFVVAVRRSIPCRQLSMAQVWRKAVKKKRLIASAPAFRSAMKRVEAARPLASMLRQRHTERERAG